MYRIAILTAMLVLAACSAKEGSMGPSSDVELRTNLGALGKRLGIELPSGTEVVHVETESGLDDAIFAKLRIPAVHAAAFIESLHVRDFQRGAADLLGPDRGSWDPHRPKGLRVGDVPLPSTRGLVVGLDESASDVLVVYLLNHGT